MTKAPEHQNLIDPITNMYNFIIEKDLFFLKEQLKDFANLVEILKADQKYTDELRIQISLSMVPDLMAQLKTLIILKI